MRTFNEGTALVLMRKGQSLVRMHTRHGAKWFLADGQLADEIAQRIVARPDVKTRDAGLFSGCAQIYRLNNKSGS
jgi:hypothetical protein